MGAHLEGKVAIVTGGGAGIGRAIAIRLATDGAAVLVADRDGRSAAAVAREISELGRYADAAELDVGTTAGRQTLIDTGVASFGRLDILVNNAGIVRVHRPEAVTEVEWDEVMTVNCKAVFFTCIATRPHLAAAGGGHIVNIASVAGKLPTPWWVPYGVSKAGVIALTRSLAVAFASDRIHVNCVCPGPIDTAMWAAMNEEGALRVGLQAGAFTQMRLQSIPLGRLGRPEDVAGVVSFLCSPDAGYMTGQAINVSGGMVTH